MGISMRRGAAFTEDVVRTLIERGILSESDDRDELRLRTAFTREVTRRTRNLEGLSSAARLEQVTDAVADRERAETLVTACENHPELIASYVELRERLSDYDHEVLLPILCSLDRFRSDPPPSSGAPAPFLPIRGEYLGAYAALYAKSIVYIWLDECDPCDLIKKDFETILEQPPSSIALFAVDGPDSSRYLQERFDVIGGPTTLFMRGDRVSTRLQGAVPRRALEAEIEKLEARQ